MKYRDFFPLNESPTDISYGVGTGEEWDDPRTNKREVRRIKKEAKPAGDITVGGKTYRLYEETKYGEYKSLFFLDKSEPILLAAHSFKETNMVDGRPSIQNSFIWRMKTEKGFMKHWFTDHIMKKYSVIVSDIMMTTFGLDFWKWLFGEFVTKKGGKMIVYDKRLKKKIPVKKPNDLDDYYGTSNIGKVFVLYRTN